MLTLVLTEKPSVARDFAKALGIQVRKGGFLEGKGYIITWALGHLVELAEPQDYHRKWRKWSLGSLPILPQQLQYKPIAKVKKQLQIVQQQLSREEVRQVVIATDAGREGEVIARTIIETVREIDPSVQRFWTSQALTAQVVRETLAQLQPASAFDRLWHAGQARQFADWLVGMNLSRAATLKMGAPREVFSVGRVQTAVLALLVDRLRERERFKPEPYWLLRANFTRTGDQATWWGTWFKGKVSRFEEKSEAEEMLAVVTGQTGRVQSVQRRQKKQPPPLLYSLTDLQREANAKFGLSAKQTLDLAQKLYERRKCLSYPRTDARVLGSKTAGLAEKIVKKLTPVYPELFQGLVPAKLSPSNKRVFNDAKLTDHHALIPLAPLAKNVSDGEKNVYELVLKRFAAVFHPDYEYEATEIITEVQQQSFRTKGSRPLIAGWRAVYGLVESEKGRTDDEPEQEDLPLLEKGDPAQVREAGLEEKLTQPPPDYTEALLLKDMTNPVRYVSEQELREIFKGDIGLGTQATRAQIIETLLARKYVQRDKKKLVPTVKGCQLIDNLRRLSKVRALATPEETARWEIELEKIAQGGGDAQAFLTAIRTFVKAGVEEFKMGDVQRTAAEPLGQCPACGGNLMEGNKGFGCSNWRERDGSCRFVVWKEIAGHKVQPETVRALAAGQQVSGLQFRSREGKPFTAGLQLEQDQATGKWQTRLIFAEQAAVGEAAAEALDPTALGSCPRCGGEVVEGKKGYGCKNWREQDGGCRFVIWKEIAGRPISRELAQELLEKKEVGPLQGFISKKGKAFSAGLRLEGENYRTTFVF